MLIIIGLAVSIPLIIWCSQLLMNLMNRFPILIVLGAALLGYTAGEMMLNDKGIAHFVESKFPLGHIIIPVALAIFGYYNWQVKKIKSWKNGQGFVGEGLMPFSATYD
ncbi:hypothetical protein GCM10020331_058570 [Ectobacillus funiculus]